MDSAEVTQRLTWLDNQRRQDAAELAHLQHDLDAQQVVVVDLSQRLEELTGQLMRAETALGRFAEIEKLLDQVKADLLNRLADETAARQAVDAARETNIDQQQGSIENLAQLIQELRADHDQTRNLLSGSLTPALEQQVENNEELAKIVQGLQADLSQTRNQLSGKITPTLQQQVANNEELAKIVQGLQADLSQARSNLAQTIGPGLEAQSEQIAALAKDLQAAQSRLARTQTLAHDLTQRTAQQNEVIGGLSRQIQTIQSDLASTQVQLIKFPQIENALAQAKTEITGLVRETERRMTEAAAKAGEARQQERLVDLKAMAHLQQQLDALPGIVERLEARVIEERRLFDAIRQLDIRKTELNQATQKNTERLSYVEERVTREAEQLTDLEEVVRSLAQDIETRTSRVPFMDEQVTRAQGRLDGLDLLVASLKTDIQDRTVLIPFLNEHLAKHGQRLDHFEAEQVKFKKRNEETAARLQFLDEWAQRSAEKIDELERFEERLKREQAELVEMERRHDAQVDQQLAQWMQDLAQFRTQLEAWNRDQRHFAEQYDAAHAMLAKIEELAQQLRREQKQIQEIQRLDMAAQRRELEEWKQANDQRWQLFEKKYEWDRSQQAKTEEAHANRLDQLETWRLQEIARTENSEKQAAIRHQELLDRLAELWAFQEDWPKRQMAELKRWFERFEESRMAAPSPTRGRQGPSPRITPYQAKVSGPKET